jgi:hypothetical protein
MDWVECKEERSCLISPFIHRNRDALFEENGKKAVAELFERTFAC